MLDKTLYKIELGILKALPMILALICFMYYNVEENGEQAAYLIGYIVQQMYKVFRELLL